MDMLVNGAGMVGQTLVSTAGSFTFGWLAVAMTVAFGTYTALSRIAP